MNIIAELFYNNMGKILIVAVMAIIMIDIYRYNIKAPEKDEPCQHTEWVQVTHRDGFLYCHDDDTVSWNGEWKPATMIEKPRGGTVKKPDIKFKKGDGYWTHDKLLIDGEEEGIDDVAFVYNEMVDVLMSIVESHNNEWHMISSENYIKARKALKNAGVEL